MRTIVAFLFAALLCAAQNLADLERQQKQVADRPGDVGARVVLLNSLTGRTVPLAAERVRELRRQHILWLIEHHPEAAIYENPALLLPAKGRLADPAGSAEAVGLWKEIASKPGVKPLEIGNAAIYLSALDLPVALRLVENYQDDPALGRARGYVDGAAVLGLSGIGQNLQFSTSADLRKSPESLAARLEIDGSNNPFLVGKAGMTLSRGQVENPLDVTFGEDDAPALGERWLRRAIDLAPPGTEWKQHLGQALQAKANRTIDPKEKVRLMSEALTMVADGAKPGLLVNLIAAEFDAGDDPSAERDANLLLQIAPRNGYAYNAAQTVLGRIAAAKGDVAEAQARLLRSVTMPAEIKNASFDPNMTLAQDLYEAGEKDAVIKFLEASRSVWKAERGRIDRMISFVKKAPSADLVQLSRQFPGSEVLRHAAPAFEATDLEGKTWTREQLAGKVAALEFGNAPLAEKVARDRGVVLLRVEDDDTRRRFEVLTNPTVVVIDRQGNVTGFRSGPASEAEWRSEFDSGFGRGVVPVVLPAPKQMDDKVAWEPVEGAESYVVEWDSRDDSGWIFDRERTVRVVATRESSVVLNSTGFKRIRWRVYAVPRAGQPGTVSPWREVDVLPVTKIYK